MNQQPLSNGEVNQQANEEVDRQIQRLDALLNGQPTGRPMGELVDQCEILFAAIREQMASLRENLTALQQTRAANGKKPLPQAVGQIITLDRGD